MNSKILRIFFSVLPLFFLAGIAHAQLGVMQGVIKDEQGNPIQGVTVTIEGEEIHRVYTLKTDKNGKYLHAGVPIQGTYRIVCKKEGFQSEGIQHVKPGFSVNDTDRGTYDFTMKPGQSGKVGFELTPEERQKLEKQQAEQEQQKALAGEVKKLFSSGLAFYNTGQYEQAIGEFLKAAEKDEKQPAVWANLGLSYQKLKQFDKALDAYQKALALKPDDVNIYQNLGGVYADMGDLTKSQEMFQKAVSLSSSTDPKTAAVQYYNMGVTYINSGKNQEAIDALLKAVEADPNHADAHYQLGLTYLGVNNVEQAVAHLKKYLELDPTGKDAETAKALIDSLGGAK